MDLLTANKTVRQLIAAVRFVGVSHDASSKHFLGKDCRDRLADLDTGFHTDYHAPPPGPAFFAE
ncbi:MAG TPA: hypothetical protein VEL72_08405 [Ktedonobacteraceae bacterium]|nr:hypothetical protein [Ktedonobacteraceae bacterium]